MSKQQPQLSDDTILDLLTAAFPAFAACETEDQQDDWLFNHIAEYGPAYVPSFLRESPEYLKAAVTALGPIALERVGPGAIVNATRYVLKHYPSTWAFLPDTVAASAEATALVVDDLIDRISAEKHIGVGRGLYIALLESLSAKAAEFGTPIDLTGAEYLMLMRVIGSDRVAYTNPATNLNQTAEFHDAALDEVLPDATANAVFAGRWLTSYSRESWTPDLFYTLAERFQTEGFNVRAVDVDDVVRVLLSGGVPAEQDTALFQTILVAALERKTFTGHCLETTLALLLPPRSLAEAAAWSELTAALPELLATAPGASRISWLFYVEPECDTDGSFGWDDQRGVAVPSSAMVDILNSVSCHQPLPRVTAEWLFDHADQLTHFDRLVKQYVAPHNGNLIRLEI